MNIKQAEKTYFMPTTKRVDLVIKKAKNQFIWDEKGKKYLDFFSGVSVCNLGHLNDAVVKAMKKQLDEYAHVSIHYYAPVYIKLGEVLAKKFGGRVFLSNTGAEANECAIKIARKFGHNTGGRYEVIAFKNSFHGRTVMTSAATGQEKFHEYLKPLPPKFVFADFNDLNSVKKLINKKTAAIIVEPVQGEGGIYAAKKEFLKGLRALADKHNLVLIFDEIQTGMGRTGKLFAYEHFGVKPDVITLAKSIANGLPLAATIANKKFGEVFTYGDHGTTFGGNPVACAAALKVVELLNKKFLDNSLKTAKYLNDKLNALKAKHKIIKEIRGLGLMIGIDLTVPSAAIVAECIKSGLIVNATHNTVVRLLPPLMITKKDVDAAVKILDTVLKKAN